MSDPEIYHVLRPFTSHLVFCFLFELEHLESRRCDSELTLHFLRFREAERDRGDERKQFDCVVAGLC